MSTDSFSQKIITASDPMDLRPIVQEIMDAANWILDRLPEGKPLVILIGENHSIASHHALEIALLKTLAKTHHVGVGLELPPSSLNTAVAMTMGLGTANDLANIFGTSSLFAPYSSKELIETCVRRGLALSFNDLEILRTTILPDDELNKHLAKENGIDISGGLSAASEEGMALRNIGIVQNAVKHIKESKPQIYFQIVGRAHVAGGTSQDLTTLDQFHKAGYTTLSISLDAENENLKPQPFPIPDQIDNHIVVKGLCSKDFTSQTTTPLEEKQHLAEIDRASGYKYDLVP